MSILNHSFLENKETLDLLHSKGIRKTTEFIAKDVEALVQQTGLPYKEVVHIRNRLLAQCSALPVSGSDLYTQVLSSTSLLSTGIQSLDEVLDGGLYTGEVLELMGDIGAGKTQVCLNVAGTTACDLNQTVLYIDTGASFSAQRLLQLLKSDVQEKEVLSRIKVCRVWTLYGLFEVLETLKVKLGLARDQFLSNLKLVVVDNVASLIYPVLGGASFTENQGMISCVGHILKQLAVEASLAVLITNNVVRSDSNAMVASLGRLWAHVPHVRVYINLPEQESNQGRRYCSLVKSSRQALNTSGSFTMTDDGPIS